MSALQLWVWPHGQPWQPANIVRCERLPYRSISSGGPDGELEQK